MITNLCWRKELTLHLIHPISNFEKKKSPMQPCTLIIPYSNMKLLKPQPNTLMQFLKIETTVHGYVGMAHTMP
jgi:hypothetical protein